MWGGWVMLITSVLACLGLAVPAEPKHRVAQFFTGHAVPVVLHAFCGLVNLGHMLALSTAVKY